MAIEVDMDGLRSFSGLAGDQAHSLEFIRDFSSNHLGNYGAFSGLLAIFRDEYEAAHRAVKESLQESVTTSGRIADAFASAHDEYARRDQRSSARMEGIAARIDAMTPYREPRGGGTAQVPDPLKDGNSLASVYEKDHWKNHTKIKLPIHGSLLPDESLHGNYTDGLDFVAEVADVVGEGQTISENTDTNRDVDDFLDEHRKG